MHILITGANRGIGAALAKAYANKVVRLSLFARKQEELTQLSAECTQLGATVFSYNVDVKNTEQLQEIITEIDNSHPVDLVIANAGIANYLDANCDEEAWETIKNLLETNLLGAIATITPLISQMRKRQKGQVALMSSLGAYYGLPISPAYCASKAGLKIYGEALRGLLCKDNVRVNVICPGFVASNMSNAFPADKPFLMTADKAAKIIQKGLVRNKACIVFPFLLHFGNKILTFLPAFLCHFILQKMGYGVSAGQK